MTQDFFSYQMLYMQKLQKLYEALTNSKASTSPALESFQHSMMQVGMKFWSNLWQNPDHLFEAQKRYVEMLQSPEPPHSSYERYFKSDFWTNTPYYNWIKDVYLKTAEWVIETIDEETLGFSLEDRKKLQFITRQWIESLNPRNFPLTNPDVIQETIDTNGENFLKGMDNLIRDIEQGAVSMTDKSAFELGVNIATTEGSVVYRNRLMEVIQYAPTTKEVYKEPLVIVPPWINKYYILDLKEENSFIKWLVDQGHTVFCISWANPDKDLSNIGFENYMHEGLLQAVNIANSICSTKQANVIGYCIGGTLLTMSLAWLKGKNADHPIRSATFLTTLIDFDKAGDLKVFIDRDNITTMNKALLDQGIMDGKTMSMTFSLLRASDLIWSFVINNYFLGKDPVPFDLLYWNSDSTNLPAKMHCNYLTSLYLDNKLAKNEYDLDGVRLDLNKIETPAYFLSAKDDHIAPWEATKSGADIYGGETEFVLSGSGHIAGVVNPPHKNKYGYEVDGKAHSGSWWPHWQNWIKKSTSMEPVKARKHLGNKQYQPLGKAPGQYVMKKI